MTSSPLNIHQKSNVQKSIVKKWRWGKFERWEGLLGVVTCACKLFIWIPGQRTTCKLFIEIRECSDFFLSIFHRFFKIDLFLPRLVNLEVLVLHNLTVYLNQCFINKGIYMVLRCIYFFHVRDKYIMFND